ncbi:MAG: TonB-dependent receptor [Vicinamibacterales bacterium]
MQIPPLRTSAMAIAIAFAGHTALAQAPPPPQLEELKQLSIEELTGTDVTTVSRRLEKLSEVAAAITVISQEDLRRSGVKSLAQALQLADGVHAARVFGAGWAISTRGFNISTANKLLVLVDGRTVYSPVYGGVFWDTIDYVIADIERIEVIRGPGGSIWGANAVNGVINIITKRAADTRGTFLDVNAGTNMYGPLAVRHGGRLGAAGSYRVYGKARTADEHLLKSGVSARDRFTFGQAGFLAESSQTGTSVWSAQGDLYAGTTGLATGLHARLGGGNLQGRWIHHETGGSETRVQAYYDRTYRRVPNQYRGVLNTVDVDGQHQLTRGRHLLVAGAGLRVYHGDDLGDGPGFFFEPQQRTSARFNIFAQDEIAVVPRFFVTLGSKLERNEFTGFEFQPTVRARFSPTANHTLWGAASHAFRVPTRFDTDLRFRVPGTSIIFLRGSDTFKSEDLIAFEGGYRFHFRDRFSIDATAYRNRYDDLRSQELPTGAGQPVVLANRLNAVTHGLELSGTLQVTPRWQIHGAYAHLWERFALDPGSTDLTAGTSEANDPQHLFTARSYLNATDRLEFDAFFRYAEALPHPALASYAELDARAGWQLRQGLEISLIGSNLLKASHVEFAAGTPLETFERSATIRLTWIF